MNKIDPKLRIPDEFTIRVMEIIKMRELLRGLNKFVKNAEDSGINILEHILFLVEYQNLLYDKLFLNISYLTSDKKNRNSKTRMEREIEIVKEQLEKEIENKKENFNFSVTQKEEVLKELKENIINQEYLEALNNIKTIRDKFVAHKEEGFDISKTNLTYKNIDTTIDYIKRIYEIRQLVKFNVGIVKISTIADYDHANIVEAVMLREEVNNLRREFEEESIINGKMELYNSNLSFFNEQIRPLFIKEDTE